MPAFEGEWFDSVRGELANQSDEVSEHPVATPIHSFVSLLEWYAKRDPAKMIGLMRENLAIMVGVSNQDLRRLLACVKETPRHAAWRDYFQGLLAMASGKLAVA